MPSPREVPPATPHLFAPTAQRPVRCKRLSHAADTRVVPHQHPWAQLAYSSSGVTRLTAAQGTFLAPPSRAVWVPPNVEHAVTMLDDCEYFTVYLAQRPGACGPAAVLEAPPAHLGGASPAARDWSVCQVLEVTELLRALILNLDTRGDDLGPGPTATEQARQDRLMHSLLDELSRARPVALGLPMPRDKRLRALCEAIVDDPARHSTLAAWAADAAASERTLARLFRSELDTSFAQWRQQALIARAMTLAAAGQPMNRIASQLGYASPSAFSAMVRRELGTTPSALFKA
ncbi:AraC family transcriptional regulator [Ideonella livida]|uniref:AraC family transcriptional regulator n=1 Tax=Ideonella livida TaxID=2707176 RepID=A0A7C9TI52_9BURK|nr:helix-turn-helix transcriptional regulator [Ideonella livida]NDY90003.1 AraC family transcriptional regulator [Ideonella livida]